MKLLLNYFLIFIGLIFVTSCVQTRTLTTDNQKLNEFGKIDYIGTYSEVYSMNWKGMIFFDSIKTAQSYRITDSIIKNGVKGVTFLSQQNKALVMNDLDLALTSTINYFKTKQKVSGFIAPNVFNQIGSQTASNYNLYFISIGFDKARIVPSFETIVMSNSLALNCLWFFDYSNTSLLMLRYMATLGANYKIPDRIQLLTFKEELSGVSTFEQKKGSKSFVIIFDKSKKEVCYVREQFFSSSKNPLDLKTQKTQIKNAFKEIYF